MALSICGLISQGFGASQAPNPATPETAAAPTPPATLPVAAPAKPAATAANDSMLQATRKATGLSAYQFRSPFLPGVQWQTQFQRMTGGSHFQNVLFQSFVLADGDVSARVDLPFVLNETGDSNYKPKIPRFGGNPYPKAQIQFRVHESRDSEIGLGFELSAPVNSTYGKSPDVGMVGSGHFKIFGPFYFETHLEALSDFGSSASNGGNSTTDLTKTWRLNGHGALLFSYWRSVVLGGFLFAEREGPVYGKNSYGRWLMREGQTATYAGGLIDILFTNRFIFETLLIKSRYLSKPGEPPRTGIQTTFSYLF